MTSTSAACPVMTVNKINYPPLVLKGPHEHGVCWAHTVGMKNIPSTSDKHNARSVPETTISLSLQQSKTQSKNKACDGDRDSLPSVWTVAQTGPNTIVVCCGGEVDVCNR